MKILKEKILKFFRTIVFLSRLLMFFVLLVGFFGLYLYSQFPSEKELRGCMTTKMYQVHLCPGSDDYVGINIISRYLQKAVVVSEDSTFWTHKGFDFQEIGKSLQRNIKARKFARGGSTITQQLAKNLFLTKEKTFSRKISEAIITLQLEKSMTKKEILERYLNVVQFGKDIFGVKKAAWHYFKKSPGSLSLVECAFLTFLLPSPEKYSRSFSQQRLTPFAKRRIKQIIHQLYDFDMISEQEYQVARDEFAGFLSSSAVKDLADEDESDEAAEVETEDQSEESQDIQSPVIRKKSKSNEQDAIENDGEEDANAEDDSSDE